MIMVDDNDGYILPFELDNEEYTFKSPQKVLEYAYQCAESGSLGDSYGWISDGEKQFPDNPDILAFLTIYNAKNWEAFRAPIETKEGCGDKTYKDRFAEKLLSMPRDSFSIRAYVACITYLLFIDPDENADRVRKLIDEMKAKNPNDIVGDIADILFEYKIDDYIERDHLSSLQVAYRGLYEIQVTSNGFSDYITSIMPLIEMIVGEFQWPTKEYMEKHKEYYDSITLRKNDNNTNS